MLIQLLHWQVQARVDTSIQLVLLQWLQVQEEDFVVGVTGVVIEEGVVECGR